ncbi:MAG: prepilin-type N-terminal cleavage/methylation domain-containing protein [Candidatus Moranbacteria bacterium]|nr:prepilin-type N-terminal cleavage/methylation domain-containing protein [Candidatus Moranbacteria bacterium]
MKKGISQKRGFSVLEVILAVALFSIFSTTAVSFVLESMQVQAQASQFENASLYAEDGLEKIRAVRDVSFDELVDGSEYGLNFNAGKWELKNGSDESEIYKRIITIETAKRDGELNIVSEDGADDLNMKKIIVDVSWKNATGENVSTQLVTYLSRWK